jgi:peptide deformylase
MVDTYTYMIAKDIITIPNPMLRQRSMRIGNVDAEINELAESMIKAAIDWENGREHEFSAALAAVQVAQPYRVIIVRDSFDEKSDNSFSVYINPEIVKHEGEPEEELEGCLSVSDIYGSVARYPKVKVKALNLDGLPIRLTAHGFLARVFQHEIDHTNGMVFVDRITDPKKLYRLNSDGKFSPLELSDAKKNIKND